LCNNKCVLGQTGEELAAGYLQRAGYRILLRNYRKKCGEIDIIAEEKGTLVFIEVKTRKTETFGSPFAAITKKKQQQISRVAQDYLSRHNLFNKPARFDVIAILIKGQQPPIIQLITNAFELC
jgi:putative endonuclease